MQIFGSRFVPQYVAALLIFAVWGRVSHATQAGPVAVPVGAPAVQTSAAKATKQPVSHLVAYLFAEKGTN
jgi:hypothetical protein